MRSGTLRLVGLVLAAAFGATACDKARGGDESGPVSGAATEGSAPAPAPGVGVAGAEDTAGTPDSAATPPPAGGSDTAPPAATGIDTSRTRSTPVPKPAATAKAPTRDTSSVASRETTSASGAGASPAASEKAAAPGKVTQVEYTGWKQYEVNCARCHGEYGLGSTIAPSLYHSFKTGAVDSAEFQKVVHGSRMPKGMPSWTGVLSEEYLHAIYKYLAGRGAGRIAAGRPIPEG
jgi:mono/diheme cytochrome c family protein